MNLADYLRRQFSYDEWANKEVLAAIRAAGGASSPANHRSLQLMSHILATELVWLERLKQLPQSVPVWPEPDLAQCEAEAATLGGLWLEFLDLITAGDVSQSISYKNSKGEEWTSAIVDVLTHVILHSAYHRGQIATHMRAHGQTPAYTDFIHGVRQGLVNMNW
ncbi:MAG TPA: DinB family protein [Candidatus Sulfotelmatobacter sp.]|nr:DinB family protein [Candidatus Sulfotelmatobacter sp.]